MARTGTGGTPRPTIHSESRAGMEMYREKVRIQGEMIIAHGDRVYSYDLDLNTLQGLVLTVEGGSTDAIFATKWIHSKGEKDNWATIYIWDAAGTAHDGSVWVNFVADGE